MLTVIVAGETQAVSLHWVLSFGVQKADGTSGHDYSHCREKSLVVQFVSHFGECEIHERLNDQRRLTLNVQLVLVTRACACVDDLCCRDVLG